jgi:hypothetical protein
MYRREEAQRAAAEREHVMRARERDRQQQEEARRAAEREAAAAETAAREWEEARRAVEREAALKAKEREIQEEARRAAEREAALKAKEREIQEEARRAAEREAALKAKERALEESGGTAEREATPKAATEEARRSTEPAAVEATTIAPKAGGVNPAKVEAGGGFDLWVITRFLRGMVLGAPEDGATPGDGTAPESKSLTNALRVHIQQKDLDIDYRNRLGAGGFRTVYRGTYHDEDVAVKVIQAFHGSDKELIKTFWQETEATYHIRHDNVVMCLGACVDITTRPPFCAIVMELCDGSLQDCIHDETLTTKDRLALLLQVASGLKFRHAKNIAHRDMKPMNVLVKKGVAKIDQRLGLGESDGRRCSLRLERRPNTSSRHVRLHGPRT